MIISCLVMCRTLESGANIGQVAGHSASPGKRSQGSHQGRRDDGGRTEDLTIKNYQHNGRVWWHMP